MFFSMIFAAFVAFPETKEAIFANEDKNNIEIETSGSFGLYYSGVCHKTLGNETITTNEYMDWCSDDKIPHPYIQFSVKDKVLRVNKFSVRSGCCTRFSSTCAPDTNEIFDDENCCRLYSYSLIASNDKKIWTTLHKVEKDVNFYYCLIRTFNLKHPNRGYKYYRFMLDDVYPFCRRCMQINQIELYGKTINSFDFTGDDNEEDDESVSIIGHVKKQY